MSVFFIYFGLACAAGMLLAGGLGHALRLRAFAKLLQAHGILPRGWTFSLATAMVMCELVPGSSAILLLASFDPRPLAAWIFAWCLLVGLCFWLYVRRLLIMPVRAESCGCSPLASPLTPTSLGPSITLVATSTLGLVGTFIGPGELPTPLAVAIVPALWGVTFSGLMVVFPAVAPPLAAGGIR